MKKNYINTTAVLITTALLVILSVSTAFAGAALKAAPVNPAFESWQKKAAGMTAAQRSAAAAYGYRPSPVNWHHLDSLEYGIYGKVSQASVKKAKASLPASYDLRSKMPAIRNQNPFGNCWTYSAMAATESNLIIKGLAKSADIDLSEWHLTCHAYNPTSAEPAFTKDPESKYYNQGGNDWVAVALLARGTGSVAEAAAPQPATEDKAYISEEIKRSHKLINALYLGSGTMREVPLNQDEERRTLIKEAIMAKGAVSVGIFWDNKGYDETNFAYNSSNILYEKKDGNEITPNHAVTIVGWDDNFGKEKFTTVQPSQNGAWIVRNSWGADAENDGGYFYLSYEESTLCDGVVYDTEEAPASERIYQYDPLGNTAFLAWDKNGLSEKKTAQESYTVFFANIFTAKGNDLLNSVAFYTSMPDQSCTVKIYTGCSASPVDGSLVAEKKITVSAPGYNTLQLDSPVRLAKGEKFSVVVETASSIPYLLPCEYRLAEYSEEATANEGEGWVSSDGLSFTDIKTAGTARGIQNVSLCLKAFAEPGDETEAAGSSSGGSCNSGAAPLVFAALLPFFISRRKKG